MKKLIAGVLLINLVLPLNIFNSAFAATPVTQTTISVKKTGSEPFDASSWDGSNLSTAGLDESEDDNVVRLQDSVTYKIEMSVNDAHLDNFVATVILDKKQAWIEIPTGCKTDSTEVNPVSSISSDKRVLTCNTGFAIEGTNKIIFPTARVIGVSDDGTEITLNDDTVSASVSVQGDGSNAASDTSDDVTVTAAFKIDTSKDYKIPDRDTDGDGQLDRLYTALKKTGPSGEDGYVVEFVIKSTYQNGSMVADSDEISFEADYNLFDYFTDDNINNNTSGIGGNLSSSGVLYTWDATLPACELIGNHGTNASVNCSVGTSGDYISPGSGLDGINDPSIDIALTDIDVRDPNGDGNLIELQVNLWFATADNISNHQSCDTTICQNFITNQVGVLNGSVVEGFNPVSTEDATGNNLLNYNGGGESVFENQTSAYPLFESGPGSYSYGISYHSAGSGKPPEQRVSLGQEVPFGMYHYFSRSRMKNGQRSQTCAKLDTTQVEYKGIAPTPDNNMAWIWRKNNPGHYSSLSGVGSNEFPVLPDTLITLYSNESNTTLTEQRDDVCYDDVDANGSVVIMKADGTLVDETGTSTTGTVDWYEDSTMVPTAADGNSGVTKVRQEWIVDADYRLEQYPLGLTFYTMTQFLTNVRTDATGYGPNKYIPLFISARYDNDGTWAAWSNSSSVEINDFEDAGFSYAYSQADRNILVPSAHSIKKYTSPSGLKVVRGGDIVDFIIEPKLFGLWNSSINTSRVIDTLPSGTAYILGSERFSMDGGNTWLNRDDFLAGNPQLTLTSAVNTNPQSIRWYFGSVDSGDQLPMIKYSIEVAPDLVSGGFTNTAGIYGDIGADNNADGVGDTKTASYRLTILPEYGFDVFKANQQDVYSTNKPFSFELLYKNLGGENYSKGDFIDILPFNGDGSGTISGFSSERTPESDFNGTYSVSKLTGSNAEVFYATDVNPTTIKNDSCHENNQLSGYVPVSGDVCFKSYQINGNAFSGGSTQGTGITPWTQCSGTNPVVCGSIDSEDITAIRFKVNNITAAAGGKTVEIELTPEGNMGGTPDIDSSSNVTSSSTGDIFTNTFSGRVPEISLLVISNDASVTMVSGSIGDKVFLDNDNSGSENTGDTPISGVKVSLLDSSGLPVYIDLSTGAVVSSTYPGAIIYTTTTDTNGNYVFTNLPSGDYTVVVDETTLPDNVQQSYDPDATLDSRSTHSLTNITDIFGEIQDVEDNVDQDFGYVALSSIGDRVWIDSNADGIQDSGELGFSGATLNLLDIGGNTVATTTTDSDGNYLFDDILTGDYKVELVMPTDYLLSLNTQGSDSTIDSDILSNLKTETISLGIDEHITDIDAGIYQQAQIGDTVWFDTNRDGIQDSGEAGIDGVTVNLLNASGSIIDTTTTSGSGTYNFSVDPGTYIVEFIEVTDHVISPENIGTASNDSNADFTTGQSEPFTVVSGDNIPTIDAGMYIPKGSISDTVWIDSNADGIQDSGELGFSGATLNLLDNLGNTIATTTTDSDGNYIFEDLLPGDYKVEFVLPTDYVLSSNSEGSDTNLDSDILSNLKTETISLGIDEHTTDIDVGIYQQAQIGDTVWFDTDKDGVQDSGELGIGGVTVNLLDEDGNIVESTTTSGSGTYNFSIDPGTYIVEFIKPLGYVSSPSNTGTPANDSNGNIITGKSEPLTVVSGDNITTIDSGMYIPTGTVGDRVWYDTNADGVQDTGETGVEGVTVKLLDEDGNTIATTATDSGGNYIFEDVPAGDYTIEFDNLPTDFVFSPSGASDENSDSNTDPETGITSVFSVVDHGIITDIDAGIYTTGSIGDTVWFDDNKDGIQGAGETGIQGVVVKLLDVNGNVLGTTSTNTSGKYLFDDLIPGDYILEFETPDGHVISPETNTTDIDLDSNIDIVTGVTESITLDSGDNVIDVDAGIYIPTGTVGDRVWYDTNADGVQDAGEVGISGITVNLLDEGGNTVATTTTNSNGNYIFEDVPAGDYTIEFNDLPTDYFFSPTGTGDENNDSNVNPQTSTTAVFSIVDHGDITNIDAGIYTKGSIGDTVWFDTNKDGIQDAGETGIQGVVVKLLDANGNVQSTTTTDVNGNYLFDDLIPGEYVLEFVAPEGYINSPETNTTDITLDSNIGIITGITESITIISGDNIIDVDAGMYIPTGTVGDTVWYDTNGDGIQDVGETGIEGVVVSLVDTDGNTVATTTTDSNGSYIFEDVVEGEYSINFIPSEGHVMSPDNVGNQTTDSNADSITGATTTFNVINRGNITEVDAGMFIPATISGTVTHDYNRGGTYDIGEESISGVVVQLLDSDGNILAETLTDSNGDYLFETLLPGTYIINIVRPDVYNTTSVVGIGTDDTIDSDINKYGITQPISVIPGDNITNIDAGFYKKGGGNTSKSTSKKIDEIEIEQSEEEMELNSAEEEPAEEKITEQKEETKEIENIVQMEEKIEEKEVLDHTLLEKDYEIYKQKKKELDKIIKTENTQGVGLKVFPKLLPKTGTAIEKRIKTVTNSKIETKIPLDYNFAGAGKMNGSIDFWKKYLPEEDRKGDEYIVVPSNGLVIPVNNVPSDTADFSQMVSGKEIKVNNYLKTGAMAYPESSKNSYGEVGNKVVFGHSSYWKNDDGRYKTHFQKIIELDTGEEVWVYKMINGEFKRFRYLVEKSYNTPQNDTSVLKPGYGSNLTLFTCTPIGGIEGRWIIKATYINEDKKQLQNEIEGFDVNFRRRNAIDKIILKLSQYGEDSKRKNIIKLYSKIVRMEELQSSEKNSAFLRYLKIKLLIEYFEK